MAKITKKPSGLNITRSGNTFTFTWSIPNCKFGQGQEALYNINGGKWKKFGNKAAIGKTDTKKTITVSGSNKITQVGFKVRGRRSNTKKNNYNWSKWSKKYYNVGAPSFKTLSITTPSKYTSQVEWELNDYSSGGAAWFLRTEYDSIFVKNNGTDVSKIPETTWKSNGLGNYYHSTSGPGKSYINPSEPSALIADGNSYRRIFRIRAVGRKANAPTTGWYYRSHVWALPYQATILEEGNYKSNVTFYTDPKSKATTKNMYSCNIYFGTNANSDHPIDSAESQYLFTTPTSDMGVPEGVSWTKHAEFIPSVANSTEQYGYVAGTNFILDNVVGQDECLFLRINTTHDGETTPGAPWRAMFGPLAPPTISSVVPNASTRSVTVTAQNNSKVPGSKMIVRYRTSYEEEGIDIGVMSEGSGAQQWTGYYPETPESITPWFEVYSVAGYGDYIQKVKQYALTSDEEILDDKDYYVKAPEGSPSAYLLIDDYSPYEPPEESEDDINPSALGWYEELTYTPEQIPILKPVTYYNVYPSMRSEVVGEGGKIPTIPQSIEVTKTDIPGTARITWEWAWDEADSVELSWADHEDAWESTDGPSTYVVSKVYASKWNISGLSIGTTWYFRVRFISKQGEVDTYGGYSDIYPLDLTAAPVVPSLTLNPTTVTENGKFKASWVYSTMDGTEQDHADIYEVTYDQSDNPVYTKLAEVDGNRQYINFTVGEAELANWSYGETHNLSVSVQSKSGRFSDGKSNPVAISVLEPITCEITETTLKTITIDDREQLSLTSLPLAINVAGADDNGYTTVIVERSAEYQIERPDEEDIVGYENETVAIMVKDGSGKFIFDIEDEESPSIIGKFDDNAAYRIIATTVDNSGQTATADFIEFEVHWDHQAHVPIAEAYVDEENEVSILRPIAPAEEDNILRYSSVSEFPSIGDISKLYIAEDTNLQYRYTGNRVYSKTEDSEAVEGKTYYTIVSSIVSNPVIEDIDLYYETKIDLVLGEIWFKSKDTVIDPEKEYYTIVSTPIDPEYFDPETAFELVETEYKENDDVCDIYRLSVDKPELIYRGARFGETYVDPYPAIGEFGGHRFVTITKYGDYKDDDSSFAWIDTGVDNDEIDKFYPHYNIVDFDAEQLHLLYEVDLSNSWQKDFQETAYLGGNIQGDWNRAVSRTGTLNVTAVTDNDQDLISGMRRLAEHSGVCHLRTKDGSSYACDIQLNEDYIYTRAPRFNKYSLSITRVDQEELDGMTYDEWIGPGEESE